MTKAAQNADTELWRQTPGDYYSPSIHVTKDGKIGINVGGIVLVEDVEVWHRINLLLTIKHRLALSNDDEIRTQFLRLTRLSSPETAVAP